MTAGAPFTLAALAAHAKRRWPDWFGCTAGTVRPLAAVGGPAHRSRLLVTLFADGEPAPRVFVKVALDRRESGFVRREAEAVEAVRRSMPPDVGGRAPTFLDREDWDGHAVAYTEAALGRRVPDPPVRHGRGRGSWRVYDRFLGQAFAWSARLADHSPQPAAHSPQSTARSPQSTAHSRQPAASSTADTPEVSVRRFADGHATSRHETAALEAFATAVEAAGLDMRPCWQHGDLALSNSLLDAGKFRFLDWEHAGPHHEPWLDVASAPVPLLSAGLRQAGGDVRGTLIELFGGRHRGGLVLRRRMQAHWRFPLPLAWGVALTCVRRTHQRVAEGRAQEPWATCARLLVADPEVRRRLDWLAPRW
jgi:aminoglycoside phosphotransferase (APT) family kinase protein